MANFNDFRKYVLPSEVEASNAVYSSYKHHLFPLSKEDVLQVDLLYKIPSELKEFYLQIGYGFFFQNKSDINRFLDPESFKMINNKEEYYEFDPTLEFFDGKTNLIFFELNEGNYLTINILNYKGKNQVYYFDDKIADSLEEFLSRFDTEGCYFE